MSLEEFRKDPRSLWGYRYPTRSEQRALDMQFGSLFSNLQEREEDGRSVLYEPVYDGNNGYVGYSMSKRAEQARREGRYPKTDFKKAYGVSLNTLKMLTDLGIIDNKEWHHTSKYGNKTTFYGWEEDGYADIYAANKRVIDVAAYKYATRLQERAANEQAWLEADKAKARYLSETYGDRAKINDILDTDSEYAKLSAEEERLRTLVGGQNMQKAKEEAWRFSKRYPSSLDMRPPNFGEMI